MLEGAIEVTVGDARALTSPPATALAFVPRSADGVSQPDTRAGTLCRRSLSQVLLSQVSSPR